jgi:hypothetical protein
MQRLHENDLVGHVLEQEAWEVVSFPAIAEEDQAYVIESPFGSRTHHRQTGDLDATWDNQLGRQALHHLVSLIARQASHHGDPSIWPGSISNSANTVATGQTFGSTKASTH